MANRSIRIGEDHNGNPVTGLPAPSAASDATPKSYVDAQIGSTTETLTGGRPPVAYATAAALPTTPVYANGALGVGATLTAGSNAAFLIDGQNPTIGTRVLVKNEATSANNGVYVLTTAGDAGTKWVLTRATDCNVLADFLPGIVYSVQSGIQPAGAVNQNKTFMSIVGASPFVVGATSFVFAPVSSVGYTQLFGDGVASTFTITHNLGTLLVHVTVFLVSTGAEEIFGVTHTDANTVTLDSGVSIPALNAYRVFVS